MNKIKVGITGQSGFVGTNLFMELQKYPEKYEPIPFEDEFFLDEKKLRAFVKQCDVVFHLAAKVRSPKPGDVYDTNIHLGNQLINAFIDEDVAPCVLFASSIQEFDDTEYGRCKHDTRVQLSNWAQQHNTGFVGMIFPNLFGPHARPNSHSFIATFCYKLTHGEEPQVIVDNNVSLKFIDSLLKELLKTIDELYVQKFNKSIRYQPDFTMKVSRVLCLLTSYRDSYLIKGVEPEISTETEKNLFTTFKSYINYQL